MALILQKNIENGQFGLWSISEEVEELEHLAALSVRDSITFAGISAMHRRKEWLATRALLRELICEPVQISYHDDGRPYLENGQYQISITHTTGFVAVFLHRMLIPGIDIELTSRLAGKVARRFLSEDELAVCRDETGLVNRRLLLHWCAKEAIFKMVPFSNVEFSTDITISWNGSLQQSGSLQGIFNHKTGPISIQLEYFEGNGVIIVWGSTPEITMIE